MKPFPSLTVPLMSFLWAGILYSQSPGDLDTTFNSTGSVTSSFHLAAASGNCLAVQADDKIIVAGAASGIDADFAIQRYNKDGSLDLTFGTGGRAVIDVAGSSDYATAVVLQGDGKIVVAGYLSLSVGFNFDFALIRLNANGTLDTSFNGTGKVTTSIGPGEDRAYGVAVDGEMRIVLAGTDGSAIALLRYNPDGSPDSNFGQTGKVVTPIGASYDSARDIAIQGDGKIVIAGHTRQPGDVDQFALLRYNSDGSLDTSFNSTGKVVTNFGGSGEARSVVVQENGKIVVAGFYDSFLALARYNANGSLDTSLNGSGTIKSRLPSNNGESGSSVAVQADDKIVVGGYRSAPQHGSVLVRFNVNGSLDSTFSGDGYVTATYGEPLYLCTGVVLQKDGKIIAAGGSFGGAPDNYVVSRYWAYDSRESWRLEHFDTTESAGNAADTFDFDQDGLINLVEYAFGLDPTSSASCQTPPGQRVGSDFVIRFDEPPGTTGITYRAEWSTLMTSENWTSVPDSGTFPTHSFTISTAGQPKAFMRLKVSSP